MAAASRHLSRCSPKRGIPTNSTAVIVCPFNGGARRRCTKANCTAKREVAVRRTHGLASSVLIYGQGRAIIHRLVFRCRPDCAVYSGLSGGR